MKIKTISSNNFFIFILLFLMGIVVFYKSLIVFFVQDDFILINHFSQNNLMIDVKNAISPPQVTHWRPVHNLYFLIAGNLFSKNYTAYHLFSLLIHTGLAFLIFITVKQITKNQITAFVSSFIYAIHPAHFVTLFWISGGATSIGFFFLILSFYLYLKKKNAPSILSFATSLLASEAMIVGIGLFIIYQLLFRNRKVVNSFNSGLFMVAIVFALIRFLFLTPKSTYDAYQIKIWPQIITNTKYYLLRIAGFAETSGDFTASIMLFTFLLFAVFLVFKKLKDEKKYNFFIFGLFPIFFGLFPFVLISNLSPHYMNISIFGFAVTMGIAISKLSPLKSFAFLLIFLTISIFNINKTFENNWVIQRSKIAQELIFQVENLNLPANSLIVFSDNPISSSKEAYISLGTGKALDFWFKDKNYKYCFSVFEDCEN